MDLSRLCFFLVVDITLSCMVGDNVEVSFVLGDVCYWEMNPKSFTTWLSAQTVCEENGGRIAVIDDEATNMNISAKLVRQVLLGCYFDYGEWRTISGQALSYQAEIKGDSVKDYIALQQDGVWNRLDIDPHDVTETGLLCSIDYEELRCPDLLVANSEVTMGEFPAYAGDTVQIECKPQHHIINYDITDRIQNFTCLNGGVWDIEQFNCIADLCPPPPLLKFGSFTPQSQSLGSVLVYSCITGYRLADGNVTKKIECTGDPPAWGPANVLESLLCIPNTCDDSISYGENSQIREYNNLEGYKLMIWCETGFKLSSGNFYSVLSCKSRGPGETPTWTSTNTPKCFSNLCTPPEIGEAVVIGTALSTVEVGQSLIYKCNGTTLFPGGSEEIQIACDDNGEWFVEPPLSGCDASKCQPGWMSYQSSCYYISNSSLGLRFDSARESCAQKYAHLVTVDTEAEKSRVLVPIYNQNQRDFWIGYHKSNGVWKWDGHAIDHPTNYTNWAVGYPEFHNCSRTTSQGYWKDRACTDLLNYICEKPAVCGNPPVIKNGNMVSTIDFPADEGQTVRYECIPKYKFPNATSAWTATCMLGGFWSWVPNCIKTQCPSLNRMENQVMNAYIESGSSNEEGAKVTFSCQDGYLFPNGFRTSTVTCLSNGEWTTLPPDCEVLICPNNRSNSFPSRNEYGYGSMNMFTCLDGYSYADGSIEKTFRCASNGDWYPSGEEYSCIARRCPTVYEPHASTPVQAVQFPNSFNITCDKGYTYPDGKKDKTARCGADGHWIVSKTVCQPSKCIGSQDLPPIVENTFRDSNSILAGSEITYTCEKSYIFTDGSRHKKAMCNPYTFEWDSVPEACITYEAYLESLMYKYPNQTMVLVISWLCFGYGLVSVLIGIYYLIGLYFEYKEMIWKPDHEKITPSGKNLTACSSVQEDITMLQVFDGGELTEMEERYSVGTSRILSPTLPTLPEEDDDTISVGEPRATTPTTKFKKAVQKQMYRSKRQREIAEEIARSLVRMKEMKEKYQKMPGVLPNLSKTKPRKQKRTSSSRSIMSNDSNLSLTTTDETVIFVMQIIDQIVTSIAGPAADSSVENTPYSTMDECSFDLISGDGHVNRDQIDCCAPEREGYFGKIEEVEENLGETDGQENHVKPEDGHHNTPDKKHWADTAKNDRTDEPATSESQRLELESVEEIV